MTASLLAVILFLVPGPHLFGFHYMRLYDDDTVVTEAH